MKIKFQIWGQYKDQNWIESFLYNLKRIKGLKLKFTQKFFKKKIESYKKGHVSYKEGLSGFLLY